MVSRDQDPTDRRRYTITLTPTGAALVSELALAAIASQRTFLSGLSVAERHTLLALLAKVISTNDAR
jgi:MarR family transcriptional regulator, lower aerobic nicotinate degradation pathway regulator